jgi:hypothetical protein
MAIPNSPGAADCYTCDQKQREGLTIIEQFEKFGSLGAFIVCPTCGNKRCPKATWHENACSGSNEPGQPGSIFSKPMHLKGTWVDG